MNEKLLLLLGLVLCTGLIAAGCGGDDDESTTAAATETTGAVTSGDSSTDGGSASDQEKASFIEGCTQAASEEAGLTSEQADALSGFCDEVFTSTDSLAEASVLVCTKTAEVLGGLAGNQLDQVRQACEADAQSAAP